MQLYVCRVGSDVYAYSIFLSHASRESESSSPFVADDRDAGDPDEHDLITETHNNSLEK